MPTLAAFGAVIYAKHLGPLGAFYAEVAQLTLTNSEPDHLVLGADQFQLFVVAIPPDLAASIPLSTPPTKRTDTPIKLRLPVANLAVARIAATKLGGGLNPVEREWVFQGQPICDGYDPEGNIFQLCERLP